MSGTCSVTPEVYVKRRSAPDPYTAPLSRRTCRVLLLLTVAAFSGIFAVKFVRGLLHEYHQVRVERDALALENDILEGQLAEMLKHGDKGILLANIGPDLSGYQLRLVPQQFKGRN